MMFPDILKIGSMQVPYPRTQSFSEVLLKLEATLLSLLSAPSGSRAVFITGSGTAAMEAAVLNFATPNGLAAVINGGAFGQRFVDILDRHRCRMHEVKVDRDTLSDGHALANVPSEVTALFVNGHETSIGHLYDLAATRRFCHDHDCLHIVDAIGMFATDELDMKKNGIDVLIISANKGLALAPGISIVAMSPKALSRIIPNPMTYYLDINPMLADGVRGQTPFTPAISVLLQLQRRLEVLASEGISKSIAKAAKLAKHFRTNIVGLPLRPYSQNMPNAMTALEVVATKLSPRAIVNVLNEDYDLVVAPNAGTLGDSIFRVAHMGNLHNSDVDCLIKALTQILG